MPSDLKTKRVFDMSPFGKKISPKVGPVNVNADTIFLWIFLVTQM